MSNFLTRKLVFTIIKIACEGSRSSSKYKASWGEDIPSMCWIWDKQMSKHERTIEWNAVACINSSTVTLVVRDITSNLRRHWEAPSLSGFFPPCASHPCLLPYSLQWNHTVLSLSPSLSFSIGPKPFKYWDKKQHLNQEKLSENASTALPLRKHYLKGWESLFSSSEYLLYCLSTWAIKAVDRKGLMA